MTNNNKKAQLIIPVEMREKVNLFTYGTLMSGRGNNILLKGQELIGKGILRGYECYALPYGFPAITEGNGEVVGEVWRIDKSLLPKVDMLESYKENDIANSMYIRNVEVVDMDTDDVACYVYVWNWALPPDAEQVKSGTVWTNHSTLRFK